MYWQCFTSIFVTINPFSPHSCAWFSDLTRELRREIFVTKNWIISKVAFLFPIQVAKEWLTGLSIFVDFTFLTVCTSLFFFERVMFRFFLFERKKKKSNYTWLILVVRNMETHEIVIIAKKNVIFEEELYYLLLCFKMLFNP